MMLKTITWDPREMLLFKVDSGAVNEGSASVGRNSMDRDIWTLP